MTEIDNKASLSRKERLNILVWVLKQVVITNKNYLPLELLRLVATLSKTFFPIIIMTPLLEALLNGAWKRAFFWGIILAVLTFLSGIIERSLYRITEVMGSSISNEMRARMHLHPLEIDYASARDTDEKKRFQLALQNMNFEMGNFKNLVARLTNLLTDILGIVLSASITLWMLSAKPISGGVEGRLAAPLISIAIAAITLLSVLTLQKGSARAFAKKKRDYALNHVSVENELQYYILEVGCAIKNYALYQLYDMLPMIKERLASNNSRSTDFFLEKGRITEMEVIAQGFVSIIILLLSYGLVGLKVVTGAIPAAMIVTCANSFIQMNSSFSGLMMRLELINNSLIYFKDIMVYMNTENKYNTGSIPVEKRTDHQVTLSFENVGFKYPGTDKWALRHVSLTLEMNKRHAVVGPNGAGKTTFILLLCRLYEPTEGRILLNGVDIRKYDYEEYLSLFSVVFQEFQLLAMTVGENVACTVDYDEALVRKSLAMAGFGDVLNKLDEKNQQVFHKGLSQTVSDYWGSGENFSGGEQQKIAIARALAKSGSVVVLDEPTAALDPISEGEIYEHLNELIEDKTTVFISHRMSSCRFCEDIIVFNRGQMVERGSHQALLDKEGLYHSMWHAQAKYYQEQGT